MAEIHQSKLHEMFADPAALYERLVNRKGYFARTPVVEFDAELTTTGWTSLGCAICCILVYHEKRAYIAMLDSVDLTNLRASLEQESMAECLAVRSIPDAGRGPGKGRPEKTWLEH
jgi:hypothetical protein